MTASHVETSAWDLANSGYTHGSKQQKPKCKNCYVDNLEESESHGSTYGIGKILTLQTGLRVGLTPKSEKRQRSGDPSTPNNQHSSGEGGWVER